jgi:hypothetical protein
MGRACGTYGSEVKSVETFDLVNLRKRNQLQDQGLDVSYRKRPARRGLDSRGAGKRQKAGCYEHGKQPLASKNDGNSIAIRGNTCFTKRVVLA